MHLTMKWALSLVVAFSFFAVVANRSFGDVSADELAKLKGTWTLVSGDQGNGEQNLENEREQFVIEGDKITSMTSGKPSIRPSNGQVETWQITLLDPSNHTLNWAQPIYEKTFTVYCIYKLDGDTLQICSSEKQAPTEFKADRKAQSQVMTFKRGLPLKPRPPSTQPTTIPAGR